MRLRILFLLAGLMHVSASTNAQTVTLKGDRLSLVSVLQAIREQAGYTIFTAKRVLRNTHPVTIDVRDMPIDQFLATVFADQPIEATLEGKTVILKNNRKSIEKGKSV